MICLLAIIIGVRCLSENTKKPDIKKDNVSRPRVIAAPNASIKNPALAAPKIIPEFFIKPLIAFACCNRSLPTIVGIIPVIAGQKTPESKP